MATHLIASLIVLALIGLIDSGYLYWHHLRKKPLACPINEKDCNAVVESKYGSFFGIKNEFLGIIFYLFILVCAGLIYKEKYSIGFYLLAASFIGLCFSLYFVYIQKFVLKKYCFYCLISAFISLLIFITVLAL